MLSGNCFPLFLWRKQVDVQEKLRQTLEEIAASQGLFLVEVKFFRHGGTLQIKVIVDKNGGILLIDCAKVSKALSKYIEEAQILDSNFSIEVSSPGIDRKFVTIDDFIRCIGKKIKVACNQPINGETEFCGTITDAVGEQIQLLLDSDQELTLNLNNIEKAKLEIGWKK